MKNLFLVVLFLFGMQIAFSQANSGIIGGYASVKAKTAHEASSGFFAGFYTDVPLLHGLDIQPELFYTHASSTDFLYLPLLLKYYLPKTDINVQAGPQATYILRDVGDSKNNLGIDLTAGLAYDLLYNVFIEARYAFKINVHDENYPPADFGTFTIGLGIGL